MKAHLLYYIKNAYLVGDVGSKHFQFKAVSGGRAGSEPDNSVREVANNPYRTGQTLNEAKNIVGGPLPCGNYQLKPDLNRHSKKHPKIKIRWINLEPDSSAMLGSRSGGFAIHGHGERGSDGCIVPVNPRDLEDLFNAVLSYAQAKAVRVTMQVVAGDLSSELV